MTPRFFRLPGDGHGHPDVNPSGGAAPSPARRAGKPGAEDGRPWEQPGAVRRDCEPHRGTWLLALADAGLLVGALSLALGVLAPLGLALGVTAWALASLDLGRMRAGLMDPAGREAAARARTRAVAGVALSLYAAALWGWFLALMTRGGR